MTTIDLNDDVRVIQRELATGFVSREVVVQKLQTLPDVADKGDWIDIFSEEGEGEGKGN